MSNRTDVRRVLDTVKAEGRTALTAPEGKVVCEAYGIAVPKEGVATSAADAAKIATAMGFPVVLKIVSPDILHKTEAGGVLVGVKSAEDAQKGYDTIIANAKKYNAKANVLGVQVQEMLTGGQEVIIGAVTDPVFGKLVAFGLGGVLVEVLKDITFRLAPATEADALSMLDGIAAAQILKGVRGAHPVNRDALAKMIQNVSQLIADYPEIAEMDLNPVFATRDGAIAAAIAECGEKKIPGAVLIPSGFAEVGNHEGQKELVSVAQKYGVRLMGPNIYGFYYTWSNLCATFCTAYDVKGHAALSSQSGGIGMAIIGFSRSAKMGVSAIVGLGNKSDIDEDDLLTFFEQDDNTHIIVQHCEDLKDGRAFAEVAKRVSKKKPVVVLKAGRTSLGSKAASSHTGALAGNDKIYDDVLRQSGVIRARSLREMLEFARALPILPTPKGDNIVIITGAGGSGVLLSDAVVDNGLSLMAFPPDLDGAFKKFIPPFGASGNPVDITGGEPPKTYQNTVRFGLEDPRIHSLILGYWHTIVTPPMVFAKLLAESVEELRGKGIDKAVVVSLAGDVEVEEAAEYLFDHGIPAYPYSTEMPVEVLGAKYKWARGADLL